MFEISGLKPVIGQKYFKGKGCDICFGSGYRGRIGVFEVLCMNDRLRKCITSGGDKQEFRSIALETDYVPMLTHASELVDEGITTVEEVARVINLE
jgi:type IV pilus assembly protein PilB